MKNKWIKSALTFATVLILTLVLGGCSPSAKAPAEDEAKVPKAKAPAVKQAAEAKALAEKRLEWTGKAMQRAGIRAETVKRTLTQGGTVVAWGYNSEGQTKVPAGLSGVVAIAAGRHQTMALMLPPDEKLVAAEPKASAEKRLEWTGKAMQRAGMKEDTVKRALTQGGTVVAWGDNDNGQTTVPAGLSGVVAIAARGFHTVALKQDGTVVAWGDNGEGQTNVPAGLSGVVAIDAGGCHTVALRMD